ncbi:MAG: DNA-binding protein WhiA [Actinobacteria bacterium]|nr:DNA-binding protein WhiA [Actinomycetota bacterium]
MSLSDDVRNELAAIAPKRECDSLAELSALFHTAGSLHLRGRGEVSAHLDLSSSAVARRAFSLLRTFGVDSEIRTYRSRSFAGAMRYQLHVAGTPRALQVFHEAGVLTARLAPLERPPRRVVARACCRGAYLRGALLGSGSVSGPRSPHLEIRAAGREGAEFLRGLAGVEEIVLRVHDRPRHVVAYAKGSETIADALALAGASDAALLFDEAAVVGDARARANRLANADHANLVRAGRAAHRQLAAVRELARDGRLDRLPGRLREVAELRLRHPSASLAELAAKARPATTKASAHRRLTRIVELAAVDPM